MSFDQIVANVVNTLSEAKKKKHGSGTGPMSKIGARKFYDAIPEEKRLPAIILLSKKISAQDRAYMRRLRAANPDDWYVSQHFFGGMAVRNYLREHGFGEKYWPIWNLDDIYVFLLEDAINKEYT